MDKQTLVIIYGQEEDLGTNFSGHAVAEINKKFSNLTLKTIVDVFLSDEPNLESANRDLRKAYERFPTFADSFQRKTCHVVLPFFLQANNLDFLVEEISADSTMVVNTAAVIDDRTREILNGFMRPFDVEFGCQPQPNRQSPSYGTWSEEIRRQDHLFQTSSGKTVGLMHPGEVNFSDRWKPVFHDKFVPTVVAKEGKISIFHCASIFAKGYDKRPGILDNDNLLFFGSLLGRLPGQGIDSTND